MVLSSDAPLSSGFTFFVSPRKFFADISATFFRAAR
jgi:hypothetical protein